MRPLRYLLAALTLLPLAAAAACSSNDQSPPLDAGPPVIDANYPEVSTKPTCVVDGIGFSLGQAIVTERHCGLCRCGKYQLECVEGVCPGTCTYEGREFAAGTILSLDEGCGGCTCNENVRGLTCKRRGFCRYEGVAHCVGETFPASDGCNTCRCDPISGHAYCTYIGCLLDASVDGR
ncbi:MAG: hypothetical protein U0174_22685 [Polyangiaceae bacterium]